MKQRGAVVSSRDGNLGGGRKSTSGSGGIDGIKKQGSKGDSSVGLGMSWGML